MWISFLTPRVLTSYNTNSNGKKKKILINYNDQLHLSLFGFWVLGFVQYSKKSLEGEQIFVRNDRVTDFAL